MDAPLAEGVSMKRGRKKGGATRRRLPWAQVAAAYVGAGLVLTIAAVAGLPEPWASAVFLLVALAAIALMSVSVWLRRPPHRWAWAAVIAAIVVFLCAGVARFALDPTGNLTATRPVVPDLLSLSGYGLLGAGLLGFSRSSSLEPQRKWSVVLDATIASLAAAMMLWIAAVQPMLEQGAALWATIVLILFPSMSIFTVVVTLRIALNPEQEHVPAYWFLLAAVVFMLASDVLYMLADAELAPIPERLLDLPYVLALLAAGMASLHPTMRMLTQTGRPTPVTRSRVRIALVGVALVVPALLILRLGPTTTDRVVMSLLMLALSGAAMLRIVQALRIAQASEARLVFQAHHDSLTELPNRRLMERHLSRLLEQARIDDTHVALLYIDLDRFKLVNDTLGHRHGDELLVEVAQRLRENVRPTDLVTRIGGDEFMILLGDVVSIPHAIDLANRLRSCLKVPFEVNGMTFYVSASIGLAYASGDDPSATVEALVRDADTAMYQAKDAGRDAVAVFDESMRVRVAQRVEIGRDLHDAVAGNQLHLVYQPIVRLPNGSMMGMEALVRWTHPRHGVVGPARFIPLAEEDGLISDIGGWVLEEAVGQFATWRRHWPEMANLYVSVNLSGLQLYDDGIVSRVADVLTVHGLPGPSLCLELTESVVMEDPEAAAAVLKELRRLGVQVAIDDFGSEYSSLAYLKRFPVTILKIDKSFVSNVAIPDSPDTTLVASIVAMAQGLGIGTVAEGVESTAQGRRLVELGCEAAQGYLYSRPVGPDRLPEVVRSLGTHKLQLVKA